MDEVLVFYMFYTYATPIRYQIRIEYKGRIYCEGYLEKNRHKVKLYMYATVLLSRHHVII